MAKVARSTSGCSCTWHCVGTVIYCGDLTDSMHGPAWLLRRPMDCPACGCAIFGFLDADLDPIRPPAQEEGWKGSVAAMDDMGRFCDAPAPATEKQEASACAR